MKSPMKSSKKKEANHQPAGRSWLTFTIVAVAVVASLYFNISIYGSPLHPAFFVASVLQVGLAFLYFMVPPRLSFMKLLIQIAAVIAPVYAAIGIPGIRPVGSSWIVFFLTFFIITVYRVRKGKTEEAKTGGKTGNIKSNIKKT